jgi:hypothetical protein
MLAEKLNTTLWASINEAKIEALLFIKKTKHKKTEASLFLVSKGMNKLGRELKRRRYPSYAFVIWSWLVDCGFR